MPARFYQPALEWNSIATLSEEESKHATKILRLKAGDQIEVFNGEGTVGLAELTDLQPKAVTYKLLNQTLHSKANPQIHLYQAIPKGKNMEWIIQKAVELGASSITPLITQNTIAQNDRPERKTKKWNKIAQEACKQCKQAWLPTVSLPILIRNIPSQPPHHQRLVATLEGEREPFHEALHNLPPDLLSITIAIGPEGDFTPQEIRFLKEQSFLPISLGDNTLRVETASLYTLSILVHHTTSRP